MIDIVRLGLSFYLLYAGIIGVNNYVMLRWIIFLGVIYLLFILVYGERVSTGIKKFYLVFFIVIIVLFNPIAPVYLYDHGLWILIDIVTGVLLLLKPIIINSLMDKDSEEYRYHFRK